MVFPWCLAFPSWQSRFGGTFLSYGTRYPFLPTYSFSCPCVWFLLSSPHPLLPSHTLCWHPYNFKSVLWLTIFESVVYFYECIACVYLGALCVQCQWRPREGIRSSRAGVNKRVSRPVGSLQEQQVLFPTESSLYSPALPRPPAHLDLFLRQSHVNQSNLEFWILLLPPPKGWDFRHTPVCLALD